MSINQSSLLGIIEGFSLQNSIFIRHQEVTQTIIQFSEGGKGEFPKVLTITSQSLMTPMKYLFA